MPDNPFKSLLVALVGLKVITGAGRARTGGWRELPSIALDLAWMSAALVGLWAPSPWGAVAGGAAFLIGIGVAEAGSRLRRRLVRARVADRRGRARVLALGQALLSPTAAHRAEYRACALLHDQARGRRSAADVEAALRSALGDALHPLERAEARRAVLEALVFAGEWQAVADALDRMRDVDAPLPAPVGVAGVTALSVLGRLAEAAAVVDHLERLPASPTGPPAGTDDLAEIERYFTKARLIFLAASGHGALVERLCAESRAARRLFHPRERALVRDLGARDRLSLDADTSFFAEQTVADVVAESLLADTSMTRAARPVATAALIAACALVYAGVAITSAEPVLATFFGSPEALVTWGGLREDLVSGGEIHRIFACTLLHANLLHLLLNLGALAALGSVVERLLGSWRFLLVYLLSGLAGLLAVLAIGERHLVVGASGALCGLMGAGLVALRGLSTSAPAHWHQRQTKEFRGWAISTAIFGALFPFVSNAAHAGGAVGGAIAAFLLGGMVPGELSSRVKRALVAVTLVLWIAFSASAAQGVAEAHRVPAAVRHRAFVKWQCAADPTSACVDAGPASPAVDPTAVP